MTRSVTEFEREYTAKANGIGLIFLALHLPVLCAASVYLGRSLAFTAGFCGLLLAGPGVLLVMARAWEGTSVAIAIAAMGFSALSIHVAGGMIEAHFHVFVTLAILSVFGRVLPLLAAGVTIALHHVLFWLWLPASVFDYEAGFGIVALHASFVVLELGPTCWIARQFGRNLWASGVVEERLHGATEQISAAARELGDASAGLAKSASQQAATLEETSACSAEIKQSASANEKLSAEALTLMAKVGQEMSQANTDLGSVKTTVEEMASTSDQIGRVVKLINEIAFQTNILSLNASIEAARAGEFGQGFAVVANEVRALAQRSAEAANDTASLLEGVVEKSKAGQQSLRELVAAMGEVTSTAREVNGHMEGIQQASRQQTRSTDQVNHSFRELERISQQTASAASEVADYGSRLNDQAAALRGIVATLAS